MPGPVTLQTQLFQIVSALSGLPGFLELSRVRLEDEPPGYQIGFQEATLRSEIMLWVAGARVYLVWVAAPKGSFEGLEADFAEVMDSFKITLPPGSEPILTSALAPETLDTIGERVSRIRGMSAPLDLKRRFQTRDEFASQAESQLLDEAGRRDMEVLKDLCLVLDLCSQSDDLVQLQLGLQREGVLGFYEPGEGALTVVTDPQELEPLAWLTYAHEYTHALQDQQLDLSSFKPEEDTFDASKALSALLEGDANLAEYLFYETLPPAQQTSLAEALQRKTDEFSMSPDVEQAPRIIRETFGWEHVAGIQFVFRLYLEGGLDAVDQASQNPPESTEQVIHPDKYLAGEKPVAVELSGLAAALGGDWRQRDSGVLGELLIGVYLSTFLNEDQAAEAAEGWGGDRYILLKDGQGRLLIAMSFSWDTVGDANEFSRAYLDFVDQKSQGQWELVQSGENLRFWAGDNIGLYLSHAVDGTLIVIGPDVPTVRTAVEQVAGTVAQE